MQLLVVTFCLAFSCAWAIDSPVVSTNSGKMFGKLEPYYNKYTDITDPARAVYEFHTIPYAKPPLGEYRFRKPDPVDPWTDVLNATKKTPACIQFDDGEEIGKGKLESEDCLYLDIWVPKATLDAAISNPMAEKVPVYIFIHGGGFLGGSISKSSYDGFVMAGREKIIVVTLQYRMGPLGFLFFGKDSTAPGNAGLWDQLEGMKWIKNNIAAFGGDPEAITIGGESAGAASTSLHLLSPKSRGYFNRAIVQSGSALAYWSNQDTRYAQSLTNGHINVLAPLKCPGVTTDSLAAAKLACLQSAAITPSEIVASHWKVYKEVGSEPFPLVDGIFLPMDPQKMLTAGTFNKVPLLIGFTREEASGWFKGSEAVATFEGTQELGLDDYNTLSQIAVKLSPMSTTMKNDIMSRYRPTVLNRKNIVAATLAITGDHALTCPTYLYADSVAETYRNQGDNYGVYVYVFNHSSGGWQGAHHAYELNFMFTGYPLFAEGGFSDTIKYFSEDVMDYFGNFIKTGNPGQIKTSYAGCSDATNPSAASEMRPWPKFDADPSCPKQIMDLSVDALVYAGCRNQMLCNYKADDCGYWRSRGYI